MIQSLFNIIKIGSKGELVYLWQKFLADLNFNLFPDGIFGPVTKAATEKFQATHQLKVDGIVGPQTFAKAQQLGFKAPLASNLRLCVIDLSHWNNISDFKKIKANGIEGIIHKATESTNFIDKTYNTRKNICKDLGFLWGAYHFIKKNGIDEAKFFIDFVKPDNYTLIALDYEDLKCSVFQAELFVETVFNHIGRFPYLYTGGYMVKGKVNFGSPLTKCRIWWARYSRNRPIIPYPLPDFTLWQFTGSGRIDGVHGDVDLNYYNDNGKSLSDVWV